MAEVTKVSGIFTVTVAKVWIYIAIHATAIITPTEEVWHKQ